MKPQFKALDDAKGEKLTGFEKNANSIVLVFESGWIAFKAEFDCDEQRTLLRPWESLVKEYPQPLLRAGAMTKEEFDQACEQRRSEILAAEEAKERRQYERLRKKFEDPARVDLMTKDA